MLKRMTVKPVIAVVIGTLVGVFGMLLWGDYLVVNHPVRADIIVVLAGDHNNLRYWRGLELLREDYGQQMLVDAPADRVYGCSYAEHAADFVAQSASDKNRKLGYA